MNQKPRADKDFDSENRYVKKSAYYRTAEKRTGNLSSEISFDSAKHHDLERDVYIKSRTFQNSNWRQPAQSWDKCLPHSDNNAQGISRKDIAAANSLMPNFGSKKESTYTPTIKAVDNLIPKFTNIDLGEQNYVIQNTQKPTSYVRNQSVQNGTSSPRHHQNSDTNWRKPSSGKDHTGLSYSIRRKFDQGYGLTAAEREGLFQPQCLHDMLGSKTSLYAAMNELDSKTLKVQMEDFGREEIACEHVKQEMASQYPNCNVIPFGIRLLGMAHPKTAIYMFFDSGNNYFQSTNETKHIQTQIRKTVFETIRKCGHCEDVRDWDVQEMVTFMHSETQMNCVVTFVNGFRHQNTLLLKSYLQIDKRLRLLMLLIGDMVYRYHDISKYFTSYVLNIMIIMFLQRISEPILPTLSQLRESFPFEKVSIGGFECGYPKNFPVSPSTNHSSVERLVKEFCAFYKNFNFEKDIVSILGPELKRSMFCPPYEIISTTEPLHSYLASLRSGENVPKMNCNLPVIVQEPFELNSNAAEKVNLTVLEVFQMMCQDAYNILSKWC
ncbi:Poly(A) RNA polymerase, mitochondrial [Frankliniella fusca]|uniref:Poly(A) RNA polymerase, mitochondrial n=1 Tax=Frankliniella fusca TaxID=407009 RepID=A0AAE1HKJ7_9NEOP|nr:Poly(A) RNA polymerase, mitochondrial [Frankliniella fusca]